MIVCTSNICSNSAESLLDYVGWINTTVGVFPFFVKTNLSNDTIYISTLMIDKDLISLTHGYDNNNLIDLLCKSCSLYKFSIIMELYFRELIERNSANNTLSTNYIEACYPTSLILSHLNELGLCHIDDINDDLTEIKIKSIGFKNR